jgi:hypothetical protein
LRSSAGTNTITYPERLSGYFREFSLFSPFIHNFHVTLSSNLPHNDLSISTAVPSSLATPFRLEAIVHKRKLIGFCCVATAVLLPLTYFVPFATAERPGLTGAAAASANTAKGSSKSAPATATLSSDHDASYLVREVVYNELHDHESHGYWRYWVEKHSSKETVIQEQIETPDGPMQIAEMSNGQPLSAEAREQEDQRIEHLLNSPSEQADHRKAYADDEHRIGRILALLPDAFAYEPAQEQILEGVRCYHMRFHPNPDYPAHSIESRIFHAMSGDLWISVQSKHLVRLDGRLQENVDFGYGILGRLYKDGWFRLERTNVGRVPGGSNGDWKTQRLEVHMSGRAMLFKTIARETSEVRGGFEPVPAGLSLQQAAVLVRKPILPSATQPASLVTSR